MVSSIQSAVSIGQTMPKIMKNWEYSEKHTIFPTDSLVLQKYCLQYIFRFFRQKAR
jgi:hypothetical protein